MSTAPNSSKLLPFAPYVASASYRTNIFDYKRWEGRPAEHTWEKEVQLMSSGWNPKMQQLIRWASRAVDELELQLQNKGELWDSCGFKTGKARPIGDFPGQMLADFLATNLLDRLLWGCSDIHPSQTRRTYFKHQQLQSKHWRPSNHPIVTKYFAINQNQIHDVLNGILSATYSTYPSYSPPGQVASASISEVSQLEESASSPTNSLTHPALWTDGSRFLAHTSTGVMAMNHIVAGKAHQISANMWMLTMSLLFILNIHERSYFDRLKHAIKQMNLSEQQRELMDNCLPEEQKSKRISSINRILPAAIALCHSPIFVLDPRVNLTDFEFHSRHLTLQKIVDTAFTDPPCTSDRAMASEKAVWKHLCCALYQVHLLDNRSKSMKTGCLSTSPVNIPLELHVNLAADITNAAAFASNHCQTSWAEWPFSTDSLCQGGVGEESDANDRDRSGGGGGRAGFQGDKEQADSEREEGGGLGRDSLEVPSGTWQSRLRAGREKSYPKENGSNEGAGKKSWTAAKKKRKLNDSSPLNVAKVAKRTKQDSALTSAELGNSFLTWVSHIEIKYQTFEDFPEIPPELPEIVQHKKAAAKGYSWVGSIKEHPEKAQMDELVNTITVIRHILPTSGGPFLQQSIQFELTWPDGCENDRQYLHNLLKNSRPAEVYQEYRAVDERGIAQQGSGSDDILPSHYFARLEGRSLDRKAFLECEQRIADRPCLIIPSRSVEEIEQGYKNPILQCDDISENLDLNVHVRRQIHDVRKFDSGDIFSHIVAGSLKDMINSNRRALNMLDIPNPALLPPKLIQKLSLDMRAAALIEGMGFPATSMRWNLCATEPALTQLHYDAGKFCTWIHNLRGSKLWFVSEDGLPDEGLAEFDVSKGRYVYFLLEEGSILTMPPGIPHAVLNITDCIAEGGHMFLRPALHKSLQIGLREHLLGHQDTNTSHVSSESILHAVLLHYYIPMTSIFPHIKGCFSATERLDLASIPYSQMEKEVSDLPTPCDLAALICMCVHAAAFEPAPVEGKEQLQSLISTFNKRQDSRQYAEEILLFLDELWAPVAQWEGQISQYLDKAGQQAIRPLINAGSPTRRVV